MAKIINTRVSDHSDGTTIRTDPNTRRVITSYVSIVVGVIVGIVVLSLAGVFHVQRAPAIDAAIAIVAIASGGGLVFGLARGQVVLYADRIDVKRYLWPTRQVPRLEIIERRTHPGAWRSAPYHILMTRDGNEVKLPPYLEHSTELQTWLAGIPLASRKYSRSH